MLKLKNTAMKTQTKNKTDKKAETIKQKQLRTDKPLAEKDEVKQAEDRQRKNIKS